MRFHRTINALAAIAVFAATIFQFGAVPSAQAHAHSQPPPSKKAIPVLNVRNFGATGNGVTDDSTAIQNAANAAAGGGAQLFFPAGNYLHFSPLVFNGITVFGVGPGSALQSNNASNCAVILTGTNPSLSSMTISTQGLAGASSIGSPNLSTLLVQNALFWTVTNVTIPTGTNTFGMYVFQSSTGAVTSNFFDGTGSNQDIGIVVILGNSVTFSNNVFQNNAAGILAEIGSFLAAQSNTIGSVSFPATLGGIEFAEVFNCSMTQNTIQLANSNANTFAILTSQCDVCSIVGNNTFGGQVGVQCASLGNLVGGSSGNLVSQNTIHNCGGPGILLSNNTNSAVQAVSNLFGECGLTDSGGSTNNAVILVNGTDASGATTFVQNNSYQGHANGLVSYVTCTFTAPHIPAGNVTGNVQTQTALPNNI